ncbi:MAG: hypothetical protein RBR97_16555 [Bacteroidales bacterium]|nr:hypothetical protein [Bacteroidales bacterium]
MKKTLMFLTIATILVSCSKYPEPDKNEGEAFKWALWYTNKYILTDVQVSNLTDTIWQKKDTVKYDELFIQVDLLGNLVEINTYYEEMSANPSIIEQKYFINKISNFKVYINSISNNLFINDITSNIRVLAKNKEGNYYSKNITNQELGYSPLKLELIKPLDISRWLSFKIELTDDKHNVFIAQTDSVFILNF